MIPLESATPPAGWHMAGQALILVVPPYRLDLTTTVLRRIALNPVEMLTADGRYMRAFAGPGGPWVVTATPAPGGDALDVAIYSPAGPAPDAATVADLVATLRRTLGTQIDLAGRTGVGVPVGLRFSRDSSLVRSVISSPPQCR